MIHPYDPSLKMSGCTAFILESQLSGLIKYLVTIGVQYFNRWKAFKRYLRACLSFSINCCCAGSDSAMSHSIVCLRQRCQRCREGNQTLGNQFSFHCGSLLQQPGKATQWVEPPHQCPRKTHSISRYFQCHKPISLDRWGSHLLRQVRGPAWLGSLAGSTSQEPRDPQHRVLPSSPLPEHPLLWEHHPT
jgi:hypothetical protein